MATDHRGRGLHAGKRTAQELGWDARGYDEGPFFAKKVEGMDEMSARSYKDTPTTWAVSKYNAPVEVVPEAGTDIGRNKKIVDSEGDAIVMGQTRTPARAMVAAEAMKKRIEEGRNLKTGRPKK